MQLIEKFAGNTFYLLIDWLFTTVLSFVFWIIVWKNLPPDAAGIIATSIGTITLLATVGMLGTQDMLAKMIPEFLRKSGLGKVRSLIHFTNKILLIVNISIAFAFLLSVFVFGLDLKLPRSALIFIGASLIFSPFVAATTVIAYGFQNMKRLYQTDLISSLLKVGVTASLIFLGFGFWGPLVGLLVSSISLLVVRRDLLLLGRRAKQSIDKKFIVRKYMAPSFFSSISWSIFNNTPVIILTLITTLSSSGIFAAAQSITNPLGLIPLIVSQALFPITSSLMVTKDHVKVQAKLIESATRYIAFISIPIFIAYIFFAKALVIVFAQLNYLAAVDIIPIIGFAALMKGFGELFFSTLFAIRKTETNRNIAIVTAVMFLILSIPLTMMFDIMGLVTAFTLSILSMSTMSYLSIRKNIKFKMPIIPLLKIFSASAFIFFVMLASDLVGLKAAVKLPIFFATVFVYMWILGKMKFYTKEDLLLIKFAKSKIPSLSSLLQRIEAFLRTQI